MNQDLDASLGTKKFDNKISRAELQQVNEWLARQHEVLDLIMLHLVPSTHVRYMLSCSVHIFEALVLIISTIIIL